MATFRVMVSYQRSFVCYTRKTDTATDYPLSTAIELAREEVNALTDKRGTINTLGYALALDLLARLNENEFSSVGSFIIVGVFNQTQVVILTRVS